MTNDTRMQRWLVVMGGLAVLGVGLRPFERTRSIEASVRRFPPPRPRSPHSSSGLAESKYVH